MLSALVALLTVATPGWPAPTFQTSVDKLVCDGVEATMQSTCTQSEPRRCMEQRMVVSSHSHPDVEVPLADRDASGTTYTIQSWACVTSDIGRSYFLLDYACVPDSACTEEDRQEEWQQLVTVAGRNLDAGHDLRGAGHEKVLTEAGLAHLMDPPGVRMRALGFTLQTPRP